MYIYIEWIYRMNLNSATAQVEHCSNLTGVVFNLIVREESFLSGICN